MPGSGPRSPWRLGAAGLEWQWTEAWSGAVTLRTKAAFASDLRLRFTVTPLANNNNINCFIGENRFDGWTLHIGGFGEADGVALTDGRLDVMLPVARARLPQALTVGQAHRIEVSLVGADIRVLIDDHQVLYYRDLRYLADRGLQPVGIECAQNRLRVHRVQVDRLAASPVVSVIAVAGRLLVLEDFAAATNELRALPWSRLTPQQAAWARFQLAWCHWQQQDLSSALAMWRQLQNDPSAPEEWRVLACWQEVRQLAWPDDELRIRVLIKRMHTWNPEPILLRILFDHLSASTMVNFQASWRMHETIRDLHRIGDWFAEWIILLRFDEQQVLHSLAALGRWMRVIQAYLLTAEFHDQVQAIHPDLLASIAPNRPATATNRTIRSVGDTCRHFLAFAPSMPTRAVPSKRPCRVRRSTCCAGCRHSKPWSWPLRPFYNVRYRQSRVRRISKPGSICCEARRFHQYR